ncbi:MetS family NSS transporter small subunit [Clostridium thermobutyricum]|nr:MetS family NSS transporter small subunit [Clostridium thermobutyricum]
MTGTSILFFIIGATVLWGGFVTSLTILLRNEKKLEADLRKDENLECDA